MSTDPFSNPDYIRDEIESNPPPVLLVRPSSATIESLQLLLAAPCYCGEEWSDRDLHSVTCEWRFIRDFVDDEEIAAILAYLTKG